MMIKLMMIMIMITIIMITINIIITITTTITCIQILEAPGPPWRGGRASGRADRQAGEADGWVGRAGARAIVYRISSVQFSPRLRLFESYASEFSVPTRIDPSHIYTTDKHTHTHTS